MYKMENFGFKRLSAQAFSWFQFSKFDFYILNKKQYVLQFYNVKNIH